MKKPIIDRYEKTDKNQVIIDVSIQSVEDLYHDFDRRAPYHRKELHQEFVDYLTECVQEIGKHPFIIRISLEKMPDEAVEGRIKQSLNNYYAYLKVIEIRKMKRMFKQFAILFSLGLALLVLAILASRRLASSQGVIEEVFARGLTIAAWVSLWEAIVKIFLELPPYRQNIRLFDRIIEGRIIFRCLK